MSKNTLNGKETNNNFKIGDIVLCMANRKYLGLYGKITGIKNNERNEIEKIYCDFETPVLPIEMLAFKDRFENVADNPTGITAAVLPSDVIALNLDNTIDIETKKETSNGVVYMVCEKTKNDGKTVKHIKLFEKYWEAKYFFNNMLKDSLQNGLAKQIREMPNMSCSSFGDMYSCSCEEKISYNINISHIPLNGDYSFSYSPFFGSGNFPYLEGN